MVMRGRLEQTRSLSSARSSAGGFDNAVGLEGFDELFTQEYEAVVRAVVVITGNRSTAIEVTQDAFTQAVVHWRKVKAYERPGAWVRRVAIRRAVAVRRRDELRRELTLATPRKSNSPPSDGVGGRLGAVLEVLSSRQRAMVVLHYLDGLAVNEAAKVLGCRPATASVHLHRARQRLAEEYECEATLAEALTNG